MKATDKAGIAASCDAGPGDGPEGEHPAHRETENRLYWVHDATYQEDNSPARTGTPRVY